MNKPPKSRPIPIIQSQEEADAAAELIAAEFEGLRRSSEFWKTVASVAFYKLGITSPETQLIMSNRDQLFVQGMGMMIAKGQFQEPDSDQKHEAMAIYLDPGEELKGKAAPPPPLPNKLVKTPEELAREEVLAKYGNKGTDASNITKEDKRTRMVERYDFLGEPIKDKDDKDK